MRPDNVQTVLLLGEPSTARSSLLFMCGLHWAEQGTKVVYISSTPLTCLPPPIHGTPIVSSEALANIRFLYLSTWQDLLKHLYSIHLHAVVPRVIIIEGLEYYCQEAGKPFDDMHAALIFASLLDAASVCGKQCGKTSCLIGSLNSEFHVDKMNRIVDIFFCNVWIVESVDEDSTVTVTSAAPCPGQESRTRLEFLQKNIHSPLILKQILSLTDINK